MAFLNILFLFSVVFFREILSREIQGNSNGCEKPAEVVGAVLQEQYRNSEHFEENANIAYKCTATYTLEWLENWERTCTDGRWSEIQFRCKELLCPYLENPQNGRRLDDNYRVGEDTTFECNTGYIISGQATLICRTDGRWSPSNPPKCNVVKCPRLSEHISNGRIRQDTSYGERNSYQVVAAYDCDFGYKLDGPQERTCLADGSWSGRDTQCTEPKCKMFEDFYGGTVQYLGERRVGTYATFRCNEDHDFYPNSDKQRITTTCGGNEEWGVIPKCFTRGVVNVPVGIESNCGSELKHNERCKMWCRSRYEMRRKDEYYRANKVSITNNNGTLNRVVDEFNCIGQRCDLNSQSYESIVFKDNTGNTLWSKVKHGTELEISCPEGEEFVPAVQNTRVTCNKGILLNLNSKCEPKKCDLGVQALEDFHFSSVDRKREITRGSVRIYCQDGFEFRSGASNPTITCNKGNWQDIPAPCRPKRCNLQSDEYKLFVFMDNNKQTITTQQVENGTSLEISCPSGRMFVPQREETPVTCFRGIFETLTSVCEHKNCTSPSIPNGILKSIEDFGKKIRFEDGDIVPHAVKVRVSCKSKYEITGNGENENRFTCSSGGFQPTNFPDCVEKKCSFGVEKGKQIGTVIHINGVLFDPVNNVEHSTEANVTCRDRYDLAEEDSEHEYTILDEENNGTMLCEYGQWNKIYTCLEQCNHPVIQDGTAEENNGHNTETYNNNDTVTFRIECDTGYSLPVSDYYVLEDDVVKLTCGKGIWDDDLPACTNDADYEEGNGPDGNNNKPDETHTDGDENNNESSTTTTEAPTPVCSTPCENGGTCIEPETCSCMDEFTGDACETAIGSCIIPSDKKYKYADADDTIIQAFSEVPNGSTLNITCLADSGTGDYYDYYEGTEPESTTITCTDGELSTIDIDCPIDEFAPAVKPEQCLKIANGKVVDQGRSVKCDSGYSLDNNLYYRYSCECDISNTREPFTCIGKRPKCKPDSCDLPDFIESRMTVENVRSKQFLSPNDESVRHGTQIKFHCSASGDTVYEPANRMFKCDKGRWVEMNSAWSFGNNGDFPKCREAMCNCLFEGKCVRDKKCECPRFTSGDECETPVCPTPCSNGGTCVGPKTCKCNDGFSGDTCETAGCVPPSELSSVDALYVDGSVIDVQDYHCLGDKVPFPKQIITCKDGSWSADVKCFSKTLYEIEIKTSSRYWAGTDGRVYINIKGDAVDETGRTYLDIPGNPFEKSRLDKIDKRLIDVGKIRMIELGVKKRKPYDGWKPSYVRIHVPSRNEEYWFEHDQSEIDTSVMLQPIVLCKPPGRLTKQSGKLFYKPGERFTCRQNYITSRDTVCQNGMWTSETSCEPSTQYRIRFQAPTSAPRSTNELSLNIIGKNGKHTDFQSLDIDFNRNINEAYVDLIYIGQIERIQVTDVDWVPDWVSITVSENEFYVFQHGNVHNGIITMFPEAFNRIDVVPNWDIIGKDFSVFTVETTDTCENSCYETIRCKSYYYYKLYHGHVTCYLIYMKTRTRSRYGGHVGHFHRSGG